VLIGIAVNGRAIAGVICQPFYNYQAGHNAVLGRIIWGIVGLGNLQAWCLFCLCCGIHVRMLLSLLIIIYGKVKVTALL